MGAKNKTKPYLGLGRNAETKEKQDVENKRKTAAFSCAQIHLSPVNLSLTGWWEQEWSLGSVSSHQPAGPLVYMMEHVKPQHSFRRVRPVLANGEEVCWALVGVLLAGKPKSNNTEQRNKEICLFNNIIIRQEHFRKKASEGVQHTLSFSKYTQKSFGTSILLIWDCWWLVGETKLWTNKKKCTNFHLEWHWIGLCIWCRNSRWKVARSVHI